MGEPQELVEPLCEKNSHKRRPTWAREVIQDAEKYGAPDGMHRESKRPRPYNNYVALLIDITDKEPSNYEQATEKKEWKDGMMEEYQWIMKNDVWEIVPILEGQSVMTSKWIYNIKHAGYGSI